MQRPLGDYKFAYWNNDSKLLVEDNKRVRHCNGQRCASVAFASADHRDVGIGVTVLAGRPMPDARAK